MSTADFDDVVSSQYELYEGDDDDDNDDSGGDLSTNDRTRGQSLTAKGDGDRFDDAGDGIPTMASRDQQGSSSSASLQWYRSPGASQGRRKRKSSTPRSQFARAHGSDSYGGDANASKVMRKDEAAAAAGEYSSSAYQLTGSDNSLIQSFMPLTVILIITISFPSPTLSLSFQT